MISTKSFYIVWLALSVTFLLLHSSATLARLNPDFLEILTRTAAKLPDDVPIKHSDELLRRLGKAPASRQADNLAAKAGSFGDDVTDVARQAARRTDVLAQLQKGLTSNPAALRQLDQLDDAGREAALVLVKGGQQLAQTVPDIAVRGKLVRAGGAELVASAGHYGDDFVKDALRLQTALEAGAVIAPAGKRAINLADFSATIVKMGQGGLDFFNSTIKPNWKVWVGSGLLTWWIIDPEGFQDTSGHLIEEGISRISQLAGEVAAKAAEGAIEGSGQAVANIGERTWSGFKEQGLIGILGVLTLLVIGSLFFRRIRYYAFKPFRWLNRTP